MRATDSLFGGFQGTQSMIMSSMMWSFARIECGIMEPNLTLLVDGIRTIVLSVRFHLTLSAIERSTIEPKAVSCIKSLGNWALGIRRSLWHWPFHISSSQRHRA